MTNIFLVITMDEKNKITIPEKYDTEDKIFNLCDISSPKFTEYLTKFNDIEGPYHKRFLSEGYKDLNLDHVRLRKNGDLVHCEHQSFLTHLIMSRNFNFLVALYHASKRKVHPFIFNTGDILKNPIVFASPTSFYAPTIINTQEIEESEKINNIRYKVEHNQKVNLFDIYDMIWIPKFRSDCKPEDIVVELTEIYSQIVINEKSRKLLQTSLALWVGKYVSDEKKELCGRNIGMSVNQMLELQEGDIINARIDGMICQAREDGKNSGILEGKRQGIHQGKRDIILTLLESMNISEVSKITKLSIKEIEDLKDPN